MVRIPWQIAHRLLIGMKMIFRRKGVILPVFCVFCSSHFLILGKCLFSNAFTACFFCLFLPFYIASSFCTDSSGLVFIIL